MLTTVTLAARCPKLVAPAMNTHMLENPITQDNLKTLEHYGFTVIPSGSGLLACGDTGSGRLPDEGVLVDYVARELEHEKDMQGMKVVVSAGGTREPMDPVRYLTNHSTGKMGYAVARACMLRGADVTLLTSSDLPPVPFVKMVPFATAAELFEAVKANAMDADALVMAAAVADYRPAQVAQDKIKKHDGELSIELERTDDFWAGSASTSRSSCLSALFDGNERSDRKFYCQAAQEKHGYDCGQQCQGAPAPVLAWIPTL